ncbi:hypothetical protein AGLY_016301 [Aphis glycines]|uniref:Uncharacterized protein n=1 Tax=Aphis glycines TaxID=307491 RepID=A0A6G0SYA5_APHGL|nr:hypothetical protein AGLY_016301 [Aphis glycines]
MNLQKTSNDISSLVSLVRSKSFPTYPEYITFTSRLQTYDMLPSKIPQNKYLLADCGFIYRGVKDVVECFSCGLVLHDWKKDDIPWIEHSRHNPECIYVLLSKGNNFVEYSVFEIRPYGKKSVTVGLLVNKKISIVILLECKITKKILNLDVEQWLTLMCKNNYNAIINNLQTRCKRVRITDNLSYSVNVKQSSIILHSNENYITLSHIDLHRLKQLQHCIDLYIIEKQKQFSSHQKTFDTAYSLIMADVNGLPSSCRRNEFTNQYIQNYDLSYSNMESNDISIMYELLQYHYNSLSDMILQDLVV